MDAWRHNTIYFKYVGQSCQGLFSLFSLFPLVHSKIKQHFFPNIIITIFDSFIISRNSAQQQAKPKHNNNKCTIKPEKSEEKKGLKYALPFFFLDVVIKTIFGKKWNPYYILHTHTSHITTCVLVAWNKNVYIMHIKMRWEGDQQKKKRFNLNKERERKKQGMGMPLKKDAMQ